MARQKIVMKVLGAAATLALLGAPAARADDPPVALALRAGTPGIGLDLDVALGGWFGARVGYSYFSINHNVNSSSNNYDGKLTLSIPTGLIDWYVFKGGFHVTAGVAANGTKIDVTGKPNAQGNYTLNGNTYPAADVASLAGTAKFGHSAAPYIGIGWGNPTHGSDRWHFQFDIGAIYGGTPKVALNAVCAAAISGTATCTQLQSDAVVEQNNLVGNVNELKWWPVINFGVAVRL